MAFAGGACEDGFDAQAGADGFSDEVRAFQRDAISFRASGAERCAKRFEPMIFARSDDCVAGRCRARFYAAR